jgi:arylsulfatase A-like enzyme
MNPQKQTRKPNIVLLFIDDMGWKDTGFMGSRYYETPNMDHLASSGAVFTNAYANAPNCAPSRACLMSGRYTPRHGIYTVGSSERGKPERRKIIPTPNKQELDVSHRTIAEFLKEAGYTSGHVGKWHLGEGEVTGPEARGFSLNVAGTHHGHPPAGYFSPYKISALPDGPEGEYLTDRLTDEAIRFIEQQKDNPFFLYFAHYAVHKPLQAKEELVRKYESKDDDGDQSNPIYAAMVESTDDSVGRIMDTLDRLGIADNTMVVLFSDNGGLGGYRENGIQSHDVTSNHPLKGGKGMLSEGGIRVPMVIRYPELVQEGTVIDTPVAGFDLLPTFLELAGVAAPESYTLDGESLQPLLTGDGALKRQELYWHCPIYLEGGKHDWRTTPGAAMRCGDWKLIEYFEDGRLELYHLAEDIGETNNLAEDQPERVQELHGRMVSWREATNAPVPSEPNPLYLPVEAS